MQLERTVNDFPSTGGNTDLLYRAIRLLMFRQKETVQPSSDAAACSAGFSAFFLWNRRRK
jgi:hypothetical protein